jgi:HEAT repeat protein
LAGRIDQALDSTLSGNGEKAPLGVTATELLSEALPAAGAIATALDRPQVGLVGHWRVHETFREAGVLTELLNALASPDPAVRASAARLCGALRMTDAVQWIGDLMGDPEPKVREAAVRSLGRLGGRRAVDILTASAAKLPLYRLAACLAQAASDVDIEALMRKPPSERAAAATVMACGLRKDFLRVPPLLGIAHDRRWPRQVRLAACRALVMISDPAATGGLRRLADTEPDPLVKAAADRAHRSLVRAAGRSWR